MSFENKLDVAFGICESELDRQTSKPKTKVWQPEEHQGKKAKRWYTPPTAGPEAKPYRWGTGKYTSADGHDENTIALTKQKQPKFKR